METIKSFLEEIQNGVDESLIKMESLRLKISDYKNKNETEKKLIENTKSKVLLVRDGLFEASLYLGDALIASEDESELESFLKNEC